ncbi:MAG TPA: hypothetical protein VF618_07465 [Thermoanaerobaculia bacterium]
MRKLSVSLFVLLLTIAVIAGAGTAPPELPNSSEGGCQECYHDMDLGPSCAEPGGYDSANRWSGCEGGWHCEYMPGGGYQCTPRCGTRCNFI